jgi:hypothetical protein
LVTDIKLQFPGLPTHLTWILSVLLWGCLKTKVCATIVDNREELWHQIHQFVSEIKNTPWIFECLQVSFSCRLSCVSMNMEAISSTSCKKRKRPLIAHLFVFFLYTTY